MNEPGTNEARPEAVLGNGLPKRLPSDARTFLDGLLTACNHAPELTTAIKPLDVAAVGRAIVSLSNGGPDLTYQDPPAAHGWSAAVRLAQWRAFVAMYWPEEADSF